jgi:CRP/FNR family transcriptional regulator, cyclic AMP receptor protein
MGAVEMRRSARRTTVQPSVLGLRRVALLEGLPDATLDALAHECTWRTFEPQQLIIARDGDDRNVYFIISGRVRATMYSRAGRQVTFDDQVAGEFLGELAALDGARRALDVIAVEPTLVAMISPAIFMQLILAQPLAVERVLKRLARLLRETSQRVIELSTLGVQNRIHAEVLRRAMKAGIRGNSARLDPAPKHTDIASRVSTNREQVTREMSVLAKRGLLAREGAVLIVLDVERLTRLVQDLRESV